MVYMFFVVKQKTAYEMRISDWSSDVCSSDLLETLGIGDAHVAQLVVQPLASDEHGDAIAAVAELDRGAQHHLLLALGKDDALRILARRLIGERQHRRRRIEPCAQAGAIDRKSTRLNSSH